MAFLLLKSSLSLTRSCLEASGASSPAPQGTGLIPRKQRLRRRGQKTTPVSPSWVSLCSISLAQKKIFKTKQQLDLLDQPSWRPSRGTGTTFYSQNQRSNYPRRSDSKQLGDEKDKASGTDSKNLFPWQRAHEKARGPHRRQAISGQGTRIRQVSRTGAVFGKIQRKPAELVTTKRCWMAPCFEANLASAPP